MGESFRSASVLDEEQKKRDHAADVVERILAAVAVCRDYAEARKYLPAETNDMTEVLDKRRRAAIDAARAAMKGKK